MQARPPPAPQNGATAALASASLLAASASRSARLAEFSERRFARALHVPTDDKEVRLALRARSNPICLFGEDAHDRRERLRALLAHEALSANAPAPPAAPPGAPIATTPASADEPEDEEYYTEGPASLREFRSKLARKSLVAAACRLACERAARSETEDGPLRRACRAAELAAVERVRESGLRASQRAQGRPLSAIAFRGDVVATGAWGGAVEIWDAATCARRGEINPHDVRISMLDFPQTNTLLSAGADGCAARMEADEDGMFRVAHVFRGHEGRVSAVRMHPLLHGTVVATTGFDGALRIYEGEELMAAHHTGHAQVTWLDFHPDGALLGTTGSEGGVRIWDMRSGRAVLTLEKAHVGQALRVAFAGDGRAFGTAGGDHAVAVWDLRKRACVKRIAAHTGIVSGLRFAGGVDGGDVLATGSFDGTVKMWATRREFALLKAHTAHEDKVMAMDVAPDASVVVTACYDKTWKVWGP